MIRSVIKLSSVALAGALLLSGCVYESQKELAPVPSALIQKMKSKGMELGGNIFVRIYKQDSQLEVWKPTSNGDYALLETYEICAWSGAIGPKYKEGDRQAPEGIYTISRGLMNPKSAYYLSFNLGYPNKFDRSYGRTGKHLMVHGDCSSRGCYAMTDEKIGEIYALAREAFDGGNKSFQVQIFPFRPTPEKLGEYKDHKHAAFWRNIREGAAHFDLTKRPPKVDVCDRTYQFNAKTASGARLNARAACPNLIRDADLTTRVARVLTNQDEVAIAQSEIILTRKVAAVEKAEKVRVAAIEKQEKDVAQEIIAKENRAKVDGFFTSIFSSILPK